jgi:hypothetical protein
MTNPDSPALRKELQDLQERVAALERQHAVEETQAPQHLELLSSEHAMREALLQFTQEIAAREGLDVALFVARFEAAKEWHRDRFLQMIEHVDPNIAAEIDGRKIRDIPTESLPPCIFPD